MVFYLVRNLIINKSKLIIFVFVSIASIATLGRENNTINILRVDKPYYILEVNPELDYFINGDISINNNDSTDIILKIIDSSNSNNSILVKDNSNSRLDKLCEKSSCFGTPDFYTEFDSTKNDSEKKKKKLFLSAGKSFRSEISLENDDIKAYGGVALSFDYILYEFNLNVVPIRIGLNSNILYSSFHLDDSAFTLDYGSEFIHLIDFSLNPALYFQSGKNVSFFVAPMFNFLLPSYELKESEFEQKYTGGFSFGSSFGVIVSFDEFSISLRAINLKNKLKSKTIIKNENDQSISEERNLSLHLSSVIVSIGVAY
jgi:hypothetical protein